MTVSAHGQGLLFGPFEEGDPRLALDGDRTTVWRFGNFSTGVGNGMTIRLDSPQRLDGLNLQAAQDGGNAITSVRVTTTARADPRARTSTSARGPRSPPGSICPTNRSPR